MLILFQHIHLKTCQLHLQAGSALFGGMWTLTLTCTHAWPPHNFLSLLPLLKRPTEKYFIPDMILSVSLSPHCEEAGWGRGSSRSNSASLLPAYVQLHSRHGGGSYNIISSAPNSISLKIHNCAKKEKKNTKQNQKREKAILKSIRLKKHMFLQA